MKIPNTPWAYFLTFRTYGTWLHGDQRLSIDRKNNLFRSPTLQINHALHHSMLHQCIEPELILTINQRKIILESMKKTCAYFKWRLIAANVRTNHVHVILRTQENINLVLRKLKAYATRDLKLQSSVLAARKKIWTRHGSTKYIWLPENLLPEFHYVVEQQGEKDALYFDQELYASYDPKLYEAYFDR